jgi:glutathione S-transferase
MKLIGSLASPFVRKVRVVLAEKKLDYEFVLEDVWSPTTTLSQANPLGKVPCLVMEDGGAMFDSRVIVEYLETMSPVGKLIPTGGRERASVKVWEALADGVAEAAILVRLERTQRPVELQSQAWVTRQLGKVTNGIKAMSQALGDNPYCVGKQFSLADVAVGSALGWIAFRFPELDWRGEHENLARLFDRLSDRVSFRDTIPVA